MFYISAVILSKNEVISTVLTTVVSRNLFAWSAEVQTSTPKKTIFFDQIFFWPLVQRKWFLHCDCVEWRPVGWNRALQQLWQAARAVWLWKAHYRSLLDSQSIGDPGFKLQTFKREVRHSDHCATGPLPSKHVPSHSLSLPWLQRAGV